MVEHVQLVLSETPKPPELPLSGKVAIDVLDNTGLQYVQLPEGVTVPFRVLYQPLGFPEQHIALLQEQYSDTTTLTPYVQLIDASNEDDFNIWVPQIVRERIARRDFLNMVTDASAREMIHVEKRIPRLFTLNVPAVELYLLFLRKYYNRPNIRLINEAEFNHLHSQLPGKTNKEKLSLLGSLFPQGDGSTLRIPHGDTMLSEEGNRGFMGSFVMAEENRVLNHTMSTHGAWIANHEFSYLLLTDSE